MWGDAVTEWYWGLIRGKNKAFDESVEVAAANENVGLGVQRRRSGNTAEREWRRKRMQDIVLI